MYLHINVYMYVYIYIHSHVNMYYILETKRHTFCPRPMALHVLVRRCVSMTFEAPEILVFAGGEEKQGLIFPYISFQ